jgi:hypothetical protein
MSKETALDEDRKRGEAHRLCEPAHVVEISGGEPLHIEQESTAIFMYGGNIAAACMATNAVASPQVSLTDEEQRTKRLEMSRTNAQRNRERKRVVVDILRAEGDRLTKSNMELKNQNSEIRKAIDIVKKQHQLKKRGEQHSIQISPAISPPKKQKVEMRVQPASSSSSASTISYGYRESGYTRLVSRRPAGFAGTGPG